MTLLERVTGVDPDRVALICGAKRLTFGRLVSEARVLGPHLALRRIILNLADPVDAIRTLVSLDGQAQAVVLTSPGLDAAVLADFVVPAAIDTLLSPRAELAGLGPVLVLDPATLSVGGAAAGRTDWIMTTSGTTGRPKLVRHSLASLTRSSRTDQARGAGQVWGLLFDFTRFAGLQVVLQSLLSGATLVVPRGELTLEEKLAELAQEGCTHLSATPTLWRKILMTAGHEALALKQVTLGGEIADDAVLEMLARRYPKARISHIFASTEAGVGFSVTDRRAGFPATYLTDPPSGIALRIEDNHLHVRNTEVGSAYLGSTDLVARDGWVNTGDVVALEGDRIMFKGRGSGVINVGGDKVHPEEVERALLSHPGVRLVRVYAKANPIMGALVAADIVASDGAEAAAGGAGALREAIKLHAAERLARHMVPAFLRLVADFETNAAGKLVRSGQLPGQYPAAKERS